MAFEKKDVQAGGAAAGEVDSGYAWWRLVLTLVLGTVACVGNWSVVVLLPTLQVEFDTVRGGASLPYTCTMLGFAFGGVVMGRLADRVGIVVPVLAGAFLLCIGYVVAAFTTGCWFLAADIRPVSLVCQASRACGRLCSLGQLSVGGGLATGHRAFPDQPRLARDPYRDRRVRPAGDGADRSAVEAAPADRNLCQGRGHDGSGSQ